MDDFVSGCFTLTSLKPVSFFITADDDASAQYQAFNTSKSDLRQLKPITILSA